MFRQTTFESGSDESRSVLAAIAKAGIGFTPVLKPVYLESPDALGGIEPIADRYAVCHPETGRAFEVVGSGYEPVGACEALPLIQPLIDAGEAEIISAGQVNHGARVYVQAKLTGSAIEVVKGDVIFASVNFATSHDGTLPVCGGHSSTRVVCQNTMQMMIRSLALRLKHTKNVRDALEQAVLEFNAQRAATKEQAERFRSFTRRKLADKKLEAFVRETLSPGAGKDPSIKVRHVDRIVELAHEAPGATPGTLYGGLNAVTYWATHERGKSEDGRMSANMFGTGTELIGRAVEVATAWATDLPLDIVQQSRVASDNHATAGALFGDLLGKSSRLPAEPSA